MPSIFDSLPQPNNGGTRCRVMVVMDKLPDSERGPFGAVLARSTDDVRSTDVAKVLRAEGYDIQASSIQRHRRGECTCAVSA